jgi:hypothetical protein
MGFFPSAEWVEELRAPPPVNRMSMPVQQPPQAVMAPQHHQVPPQHHGSMAALPGGSGGLPGHHSMNLSQPSLGQMPGQQPGPSQIPAQPTRRRCRAIFEMAALNQNELALREGDILFIESEADGWYFGTNTRGERGMFPGSFVILEN